MLDQKPVTEKCICWRCAEEFDLCSAIGPSDICDLCAEKLRAFIFTGSGPKGPRPTGKGKD